MEFKNKKILVTGATGFIGQNLVLRLLKLGAKVTGISLESSFIKDSNYIHRKESITPQITLENYEVIFHLAGMMYAPPNS